MDSKRPKFATRTILLRGAQQRGLGINLLSNVPLDPDRPLELVVREEKKARKLDQNAAMWAGPLDDIEKQAWVDGRQFRAETWHEYFKRKYLPDENQLDYEELAELVKDPENYKKWDIDPAGERVLVGSTTDLTIMGFSRYMNELEAEGAGMTVHFSAPPRMARSA